MPARALKRVYGVMVGMYAMRPKSKNARKGIETFSSSVWDEFFVCRPKSKNARKGIETLRRARIHQPMDASEKQKCPQGH